MYLQMPFDAPIKTNGSFIGSSMPAFRPPGLYQGAYCTTYGVGKSAGQRIFKLRGGFTFVSQLAVIRRF